MKRIILTAFASVLVGLRAFGGIYFDQTFTSGFQNNGVIPDGSLNGLADTRTVSGASGNWQISGVTVTLNVSGGYNGDLYAYLSHGGVLVPLLNRSGVGSTSGDGFGASGSGLSSLVMSSGQAADNNVHFLLADGNNAGGTYAPDGRAIDPLSAASAFDLTPRMNALQAWNSTDPNGSWTLFFADTVTGGGSPILVSWSLDITAVPEPVNVALGIFGGVMVVGGLCRIKPLRSRLHHCWVGFNHWLDAV